jgi:LacI family transcriptional regulator
MTLEQRQSKRSTMAQIAMEAGVSTTTVSKVLNQLPGVGASTRARIWHRSQERGPTSATLADCQG